MYALPTISKLTRKIFETWELGIKVFKIKKGENSSPVCHMLILRQRTFYDQAMFPTDATGRHIFSDAK